VFLFLGKISHEDGWSFCTPHFLFLFPNKKRKRAVHGPKEKNKGMRFYGGAPEGMVDKYE